MRENESKFNAWMSHTMSLDSAHSDYVIYGDMAEMPISGDHLKRETIKRESK